MQLSWNGSYSENSLQGRGGKEAREKAHNPSLKCKGRSKKACRALLHKAWLLFPLPEKRVFHKVANFRVFLTFYSGCHQMAQIICTVFSVVMMFLVTMDPINPITTPSLTFGELMHRFRLSDKLLPSLHTGISLTLGDLFLSLQLSGTGIPLLLHFRTNY